MWVEALDSKPSTQLGVQHFFTPWCGGADGARDATLYLLVVGTYCARAAIGSKVRVHGRVHGGRTRRVKERAGWQSGVGVGERVCKNLACWVPSAGLQRQRFTCGSPRERQWQKSNIIVCVVVSKHQTLEIARADLDRMVALPVESTCNTKVVIPHRNISHISWCPPETRWTREAP